MHGCPSACGEAQPCLPGAAGPGAAAPHTFFSTAALSDAAPAQESRKTSTPAAVRGTLTYNVPIQTS